MGFDYLNNREISLETKIIFFPYEKKCLKAYNL